MIQNMSQKDIAMNICLLIRELRESGKMDKEIISLMSDLLTKSDEELEKEVLNLIKEEIKKITK